MSIKVVAYVPTVSKELLPRISARFAECGMECQFHPGFALDPSRNPGQVPVRLRVRESDLLQYQDADMLSGFEISFKDWRYTAPLAMSPAINEKLKACKMQVIIRMHAVPTSALRTGMYFTAFLAQLTDGVVYVPRSDEYLDPAQALLHIAHDVDKYERELPSEDWRVVPFRDWTSTTSSTR